MEFVQKLNFIILATLFSLLGISIVAESESNINVNLIWCNANGYVQGDSYADSVTFVLADLVDGAQSRQGFDYSTLSPYAAAFSQGRATCNMALSNNHCTSCLLAAKAALTSGCPYSVGGRVEMVDCAIRYENYPF